MQHGRQAPQIKLRVSYVLKDWIQSEAKKNLRSLNAEIVLRLEHERAKENAPTAGTVEAL